MTLEFVGRKESRTISVYTRITGSPLWIGQISEYLGRWTFVAREPMGWNTIYNVSSVEMREIEDYIRREMV